MRGQGSCKIVETRPTKNHGLFKLIGQHEMTIGVNRFLHALSFVAARHRQAVLPR